MSAKRLLAHYNRIGDAPDAIAQLRRFVLDLAVRGKLVLQDTKDEPASDLLKRIETEKTRLSSERKIKTHPAFMAVTEADALHELPKTWAWVRVGDIFDYDAGRKCDPKQLDQSRWLLELEDIERDTSRFVQRLSVTDRNPQSTKSEFNLGDILYGKLRPYLNKVVVADEPGYSTTEIVAIRPFLSICPEYCALAFRRPDFVNYVERLGRGTKMPRLRTPDAIIAPFPLPPLREQRRIVAKVDELMSLCDQLEAARASREVVRDRLTVASLGRLGTPNPKTFQADARFTLNSLPAFTAHPDRIKALRQTILSLALRGKLVSQDASDEPATELAKRIVKKRADLLKAGYPNPDEAGAQIKKLAEQSIPDSLEVLPKGWIWSTLLSCSALVVDCKNKTAPYAGSGIRLIRTTNVRDGKMNDNEQKFVDQKTYETWSARCTPEPGDILITREAPMGEVCLIPPGEQVCLGQRMMLARLVENTINKDFMILSLRDPKLMSRVQDKPIGATVQHLRVGGVETLLIPLPPLAEQQRIVAKVDALTSLCDRLETALAAAASARARLLDAVLAEVLAPADDSSGPTVEPNAAAASPRATITTERSAFVLSLAYERHRAARRERTFGHVKAEKILHLVEAEAGLDLGRVPIRIAAGPADFPRLLGVDEWARHHRRFDFGQKGKGYTFEPLADFQRSLQIGETIDAPTRARIEAIIDTFVPIDTEAAELFATVYTAWNNLLIEGKRPKDDDILRAAREDWHPKKLQIPREKFVAALQRVKASAFVPSGRGKFVPPAPQRDLFSKQ